MRLSLVDFHGSCIEKKPRLELQQKFHSCRTAYKKISVLFDYFNQRESLLINGPNLPRTESEIADQIVLPSGFQVIEEPLFGEGALPYELFNKQTKLILESIERIESEPDRIYKFKDELVFLSIRQAMIRIISLGITGYDSPVALHSLAETSETLDGIKNILQIYKPQLQSKNNKLYDDIIVKVDSAIWCLMQGKSFEEFDRLTFITDYISPLSRLLHTAAESIGAEKPSGKFPVNSSAKTVFDTSAFNVDFFSPPPPYTMTPEKIELGRILFYDPMLSSTGTRSCASCHMPQKAFSDGLPTALALDNITKLERNTPTLFNAALQTAQFWDSRADILENQLDEVVHNEKEMKGSLKQIVGKLKVNDRYRKLFEKAYSEDKTPIVEFNIANAICSYIRSLVALNSKFDRFMRNDPSALSESEKKGFNLFAGKAKCATCHFIPLFNGVVPPEFTETESEVLGVPATNKKKNPVLDQDLGKGGFTKSDVHKFAFKIPTLRNVSLTAPYMHNGVFSSLQEVMEFYNNGGGYGLGIGPDNQTLPKEKLNLDKKEIRLIISFMGALSDTTNYR